jgi:excisionase family DNA binding protein
MSDQNPRAAPEQWYGAQEAARLLGIHRSTLHLAVQHGLIVPDFVTPGKHLRFSQATLDAFSEHLRAEAATNEARFLAPIQILASLARTLTMPDGAARACQEAVTMLCESNIGIDMACVAASVDEPADRHGLQLVAQRGFPDWFFQEYGRLHPNLRLAPRRVVRTMEPVVCEDAMEVDARENRALQLVKQANIRSYAVLPIPGPNGRTRRAYGVLVVASKPPRRLMQANANLLSIVADQLAVALAEAVLPALIDVQITRRVMQRSFVTLANAAGTPDQENCRRLQEIFLEETGAETVCALGFGMSEDLDRLDPRLLGLACEACAGDRLVRQLWYDGGVVSRTAAAASTPLRPHHRAAIGAVWSGARRCGEAEHTLFVGFASAYALASRAPVG